MARPGEERLILSIDLPDGTSLPSALLAVARDIQDDRDESGYARIEGGPDVSWRLSRPADGVPIDPRQREAAAALVTAFDLPQDATSWAKSMLEACVVNPGMKLTSMPNRIGGLREARRLVDEMLTEAGETTAGQSQPVAPPVPEGDDVRVLRLYRLTPEEDETISRMAMARNISRGDLVVAAVRRYIAESSS